MMKISLYCSIVITFVSPKNIQTFREISQGNLSWVIFIQKPRTNIATTTLGVHDTLYVFFKRQISSKNCAATCFVVHKKNNTFFMSPKPILKADTSASLFVVHLEKWLTKVVLCKTPF